MYAIVQGEFGGPEVLVLQEAADLEAGTGEVRIAVRAAGVHVVDTAIRAGRPFGPGPLPTLPMIPGREVAGVVDQVGDGVDPVWSGRRVVTHLGVANGGYAEQVVASVDRLHVVPDGLADDVAVAAIGTGRTATAILDHVDIDAGVTVLVTSAAGGLGALLLQAARNAGARVIGAAGGSAKTWIARGLGADLVVDYTDASWAERAGPFDVVLDGVGGDVARSALGRLAPNGTFYSFGWTSGDRDGLDEPRVRDLLGPDLMDRPIAELEREALTAAADGVCVPLVGSRFALRDAAGAHQALTGRRTHGKVVLIPGEE